jgi:tryptophan-rich hypothetical protein
MTKSTKPVVSPKKLLNSKWTAVKPTNKEKHFMVTKLVTPETLGQAIEFIELQAVYSKRTETLPWRQLNDKSVWLQGWISR